MKIELGPLPYSSSSFLGLEATFQQEKGVLTYIYNWLCWICCVSCVEQSLLLLQIMDSTQQLTQENTE